MSSFGSISYGSSTYGGSGGEGVVLYTFTIDAKTRILVPVTVTISAKARILNTYSGSLTSKGRIQRTELASLTSKGRIQRTETFTVDGKTYIVYLRDVAIDAIGRIQRTETQTVTAVGRIEHLGVTGALEAKTYVVFDHIATCTTRCRISMPDEFYTALESQTRTITGRLEIMWGGNEWTEESIYLISAKGNSQYTGRTGDIVADECDFELDNTDQRFNPDNVDSPIYQYLKPNTNVRFAIGVNGYYSRVFIGTITGIDPNERSGIVNIHCTDYTKKLINKTAPEDVYTSKKYSEIIATLAESCGITSGYYNIEESDVTAEGVWFEDKKSAEVMSEITVAEQGRLFFDTSGILNWWNRNHFFNQQPSITLSRLNWVKDVRNSIEEQELVNKIQVTSRPRKPDGEQVVWSNGDAVASNQYSTPLVWVPAGEYQNAWIELDDPCIDWVEPVATTDFVANSQADGGGTDLTADISITDFVAYQQKVFIQVTNSGATDAFLTEFNVRANPLKIFRWIRSTYEDSNSIAVYGEQKTDIENNWIQTDDQATNIKETEVANNKDSIKLYRADIIGRPDVLAGELITIEASQGDYGVFVVKELDWSVDSNGYNQSLELTTKWVSSSTMDFSHGIGSGVIGRGVIGQSHNRTTYEVTCEAKVRIA